MPPNTVSVTRPGKWGNPAVIGDYFMVGDPGGHSGPFRMSWCKTSKKYADGRFTLVDSAETAVAMFRKLTATGYLKATVAELRGKNLACYCRLDQPCHADVLLEIANADKRQSSRHFGGRGTPHDYQRARCQNELVPVCARARGR